MKMPRTPPFPNALWSLTAPSLGEILSLVPGPLYDSKYLHWDDLLRRTPPSGLTHEQWWHGLKIHRCASIRRIPLVDKGGKPFSFILPDPIPEQLHKIDLDAVGRIEMPDQITNPETRDRFYISSLIEEAVTSSQLEGATSTREVAKEMIRSGRNPRDQSERMILNNFLTMKRVGELKDSRLTPGLLFDLHRIVTDGTLEDPSASGRFRTAEKTINVSDDFGEVFHDPPPARELPERLAIMCRFANGESPEAFVHPVIRAIVLHFWLGYDHPFVDGNGRTARALFYWCMLRNGYWMFEFLSISHILRKAPAQYSRAFLLTETDENDLTYFILFHLDVIQRAIKALHAYLEAKSRTLRALEKDLKALPRFNHRQRALLGHALHHPGHEYTFESHKRSHNIVHQTARTDLLELKELNLLKSSRRGRRWIFTGPIDLESRLRRAE